MDDSQSMLIILMTTVLPSELLYLKNTRLHHVSLCWWLSIKWSWSNSIKSHRSWPIVGSEMLLGVNYKTMTLLCVCGQRGWEPSSAREATAVVLVLLPFRISLAEVPGCWVVTEKGISWWQSVGPLRILGGWIHCPFRLYTFTIKSPTKTLQASKQSNKQTETNRPNKKKKSSSRLPLISSTPQRVFLHFFFLLSM